MTSGPTTALKAAILGRPYTIGFRGPRTSSSPRTSPRSSSGASTRPMARTSSIRTVRPRPSTTSIAMIDEIVPGDRRGLIDCDGPNLPIPGALDDCRTGRRDRTATPDVTCETAWHPPTPRSWPLHARGSLDLRDLPERCDHDLHLPHRMPHRSPRRGSSGPKDNCAVVKFGVTAGTRVEVSGETLTVSEDIGPGHRFAVEAIAAGEFVRQYAQPIGTSRGLAAG